MHHRMYFHIIWTTLDRARTIDLARAHFLCGFLRAMARRDGCYILELNIVSTHVHLLLRATPAIAISDLVKRLKGASSRVCAREGHGGAQIRLVLGKRYSVTTVGPKSLQRVRDYLRIQPEKHLAEAIAGWEGDPAVEYEAHERPRATHGAGESVRRVTGSQHRDPR